MTDIDMDDEDDFPQEVTGHVPSHRFGEFIGRMWLSQEEKEYLKQIKVRYSLLFALIPSLNKTCMLFFI